MTTTQTTRYDTMSRGELINALVAHDETLQAIYSTIHLPNEKMAPGEKLFLIGARCVLAGEKPNTDGLVRLPTDDISAFIGMSESSASRYATAVIERCNATKVPVPYVTQKGQKCTLIYVDKAEPVWREPWHVNIPEDKERTINGNGKYCERCKTYNLQVTTRRLTYQEIQECECCGYTKVSPVLEDKSELTPGEYPPDKKGPQAGEPFSNEEKGPQAGEPFADEQQEPEKAPTFATLTSTNSPPLHEFSFEAWLEKRIGSGQCIYSTGDVEEVRQAKYYSFPEGHELNTTAYVAGLKAHMYGSPLRLADGQTWVLNFDIDGKDREQYARRADYLRALARAGAAPVFWPRREGTGHLEFYFDSTVEPAAARAWCLGMCPDLAALECYPVNQTHKGRVSWPLYHRLKTFSENGLILADQVHECPAEFAFPGDPERVVTCPGIQTDKAGLAALLAHAVTPAALIPELPSMVEETNAAVGGVLLDKPVEVLPGRPYTTDEAKIVIAEFNRMHTWEEIITHHRTLHRDRFSLRPDDDKPSCVITGEKATDYGRTERKARDKYEVWCLLNGIDKKADLYERCARYRNEHQAGETQAADEIPLSFKETPCVRCGSTDAVKRADGVWVCPCTLPIMQREQLT